MIDSQGKDRIAVVGYKNATLTQEFYWWISEEFKQHLEIVEPEDLDIRNDTAYIVSVTRDQQERKQIIDCLQTSTLATFIHNTSVLHGSCTVRPGSFIGPFSGIYFNVILDKHCIVGPNCTISHSTHIGQNTIMHPNVTISGSCRVGNDCLFGVRSTVLDKINIVNGVFVAAGAMITKDITDSGFYVGAPARKREQLS